MEFYVSFEIFGRFYAIKANKLLKVYQYFINKESFKENEKYRIFTVNNTKIKSVNPFLVFENQIGTTTLDSIVLVENEKGGQIGIPVNKIGELHLLDENQIKINYENGSQNAFFSYNNQSIKIIHEV